MIYQDLHQDDYETTLAWNAYILYIHTLYISSLICLSTFFFKTLLQGPADYLGPAPIFNVLLSDSFHFQSWIR